MGATRLAWMENQEKPRRSVQNQTRGPASRPQRDVAGEDVEAARAQRVRCSTNSPGLRGTSS